MNTQQDHHQNGEGSKLHPDDLETRVAELESQVEVLAAAVDAASRMEVATPRRVDQDIRLAGGRLVRQILERSHRVANINKTPRAG